MAEGGITGYRRAACPKNYGVSRAYLFGSYARGEALPGSDVDLRIDGGRIKSMFGFGGLYHELTEALKKQVDLVTTYWPAIKGMCNLFAHNYGAIDIDLVWETAVNDIPMLLAFCEQSIAMHRLMEQEEVE